jgi:very-short-patch-repair endonuclease
MKIQYNPKLKILARSLRNRSTLAEVLLWNQLKARKVRGYQFMRQKPIDNYIVDFYCSKLQLIIEIDGSSHDFKFMNDLRRQRKLETLGLKILRFGDEDIKNKLEGVLHSIEKWIIQFENNKQK